MDVKIIVIPVVVVLLAFVVMLVAAWVKRRRAWEAGAVSLSSEEANPAMAARMLVPHYETSFSDNVVSIPQQGSFSASSVEVLDGTWHSTIYKSC